ncbi:MAG: hypothetical protein KGZ80_01690 [Methylomonas sp.]|nr:hypothetical protein [Methylomonas sp.]PPD22149.1 MAG: hypothetical protein CTY23_03470 [Methylomonas sp.]PPD24991.1 MAG: hypothetical protein CTY22_10015 [Methylomonas sp.]PPD34319.1 MAG: hypothetical protein CTY21_09995 [Methylomonas sp.]PPD42387.1 MAG: hypothetical protein CTY17_01200 [Methylomonas sp.]
MWKNVMFYFISGWIVEGLIADPADGVLEVSGRTLMAFSTVALILLLEKKWAYYSRLYTSIFVCENFIMTLAILTELLDFWLVMQHYPYREELGIGIAVCLVTWYIAIVAYIFRRFFAYPISVSLIFAFGYFVMTYGIPMLLMDI